MRNIIQKIEWKEVTRILEDLLVKECTSSIAYLLRFFKYNTGVPLDVLPSLEFSFNYL